MEEVLFIIEEIDVVTFAKALFQSLMTEWKVKKEWRQNLWGTIHDISGKQLQSSAEAEVTTVGNKSDGSTLVQKTVGVYDTEKFFRF